MPENTDPTSGDQPTNEKKPSRPLSEISHLFLSSLRDSAGENRPRPQRTPPGAPRPPAPKNSAVPPVRRDQTIDLTPEEFAQVFGVPETQPSAGDENVRRKRVTAVIGAHLNGQLVDRVTQYATHLAASGACVGVILVDASELKLDVVHTTDVDVESQTVPEDVLDDRRMTEALLELNHDVDRWLLVMPDPRRVEARAMLRMVDDWVLLSTCDHDGVVSGYRTLKGLAEGPKAPLSIALLQAQSLASAEKVFTKLAGVCRQFLDWDVEHETPVIQGENSSPISSIHTVLWCRSTRDKAQLASAPQWRVVQSFLEVEPDESAQSAHFGTPTDIAGNEDNAWTATPEPTASVKSDYGRPSHLGAVGSSRGPVADKSDRSTFNETPAMRITPSTESHSSNGLQSKGGSSQVSMQSMPADEGHVVELPAGVSVLSAVLNQGGSLLAMPIGVPMCPGSVVALDRDRSLVLVTQAGAGLSGLGAVAAGMKWLEDSRHLIAMAMPQLSVDASISPRVHLLIDHADRSADGIKPLLGNSRITVQTYRKLRWGDRTGLLLEAA